MWLTTYFLQLKILITGANGFLGSYIVKSFKDTSHSVRVLVRKKIDINEYDWGEEIDVYYGDLCSSKGLEEVFDDVDVLIHLAAKTSGDVKEQYKSTVVGTKRLLVAMSNSSTRRLVLASSFSVYDWRHIHDELTENSKTETQDIYDREAYAIAKAQQEQLVRNYCEKYGWELTVLRPGAIWGPERLDIPDIGYRIGPFQFVVSPLARLRLTYVENCAEVFVNACENPNAVGQTFNITDGHNVTSWCYAGVYAKRLGKLHFRIPVPYRVGLFMTYFTLALGRIIGKDAYLPNILIPRRYEARFKSVHYQDSKLREMLGYTPRYCFKIATDRAFNHQLHT